MATIDAGNHGAVTHFTDDGSSLEGPAKSSYLLWHEKPVGKFCIGFVTFVVAEILVLVTLHWIFHII